MNARMTALLFLSIIACSAAGRAETMQVHVRIRQKGNEEKTVTRENLIRIKHFILKNGQRETYCNMYNDNPAHRTKEFRFYLNPDSGQQNINCDPEKSDFNSLTIRSAAGGKNQYRTVEFLDRHFIDITANWPTDDLTVSQVRQLVEEAIREILMEVDQKNPKQPSQATP